MVLTDLAERTSMDIGGVPQLFFRLDGRSLQGLLRIGPIRALLDAVRSIGALQPGCY